MPLTSRQAFKAGMLLRMVQDGLNPEQRLERATQINEKLARFEKAALFGIPGADIPGRAFSMLGSTVGSLAPWGVVAGIAGPPLAGAFVGNRLSHAMDVDSTDVEEARKRELISEYQRLSEEAQRQTAASRQAHLQQLHQRRRAPY